MVNLCSEEKEEREAIQAVTIELVIKEEVVAIEEKEEELNFVWNILGNPPFGRKKAR
jgi:hypothetical protein